MGECQITQKPTFSVLRGDLALIDLNRRCARHGNVCQNTGIAHLVSFSKFADWQKSWLSLKTDAPSLCGTCWGDVMKSSATTCQWRWLEHQIHTHLNPSLLPVPFKPIFSSLSSDGAITVLLCRDCWTCVCEKYSLFSIISLVFAIGIFLLSPYSSQAIAS